MDTTIADPLIGQVLDGRYRIESKIARGGMATVYTAVDTRLDRRVAVKVMHPSLVDDETFVTRFIREAKSAARLAHPNVVPVYDQGEDGSRVFLVMEYVPGKTLRQVLTERGRLTLEQAVPIMDAVLAALGAAHAAGLVHRDVKPENVLLGDDGRVRVADFGLARAAASTSTTAASGLLIGTVAYVAPEQVLTGVTDARSDLYSAGVMFYEMLTGVAPFTGDTPLSIAYRHVHEDVPMPSEYAPGIDPRGDAIVVLACAREPADRPLDAAELQSRLRALGTSLPAPRTSDTEILPVDAATVIVDRPPAPRRGRRRRRTADDAPVGRSRRPLRWAVLASICGLAIIAGTVGAHLLTTAKIADVRGRTVAAAQSELVGQGLKVAVAGHEYSPYPPGSVAVERPAAGVRVNKGTVITLTLSLGLRPIPLPHVSGSAATASATLTQAGFTPAIVHVHSLAVPTGQVIGTHPSAGHLTVPGTTVTVFVSIGPPPVVIPAIAAGTSAAVATQTLTHAGLKVATTEEFSKTIAAGDVISLSPSSGTVLEGTTVTLTVSKGPPLVLVPDLVGKPVNTAVADLQALGFHVVIDRAPFGPGYVLAGNPGGMQPYGSTITLAVF